jgi:hypothetical protein
MAKLYLGLSLFAGGLLAWACSSDKNTAFPPSTNTTTATHTNTDGTTSTVTVTSTTTDTNVGIDTGTETKPDPDAAVRRQKVCDANGENCKCINLASIGAAASKSYGTGSDSTNEFESWLSTKSNANVTFFIDKPGTIDMTWLNNYDVILIQDLRKWVFTVAEQQAFQQWINEGGGVIALSGYFNDDALEILNPNGLLAPTGMSILADEVPSQNACTTADGIAAGNLVCPNSPTNTNANPASKCFCWGNSYPVSDFTANHPIAVNVKAVGAFRGRAVNVGTGNVVASVGGVPVAGEITVGKGKVFIFGDEWVTYTSQWTTGGQPVTTVDPYNPCWVDQTTAATNPVTGAPFTSCLAGQVFQAKQFWYNAVSFVSPPTQCDFVIKEPEVIIIQ